MLTVNPSELHGLLTDVLRTAGSDVTMPMLNGLLLHVETEGDSAVLVGSSTDRFRFGQAHVPATGEIPPTFVKASSVRQLLTALQPYAKAHDLLSEVTVTERVKMTLKLPGDMVLPAVTITVHCEDDATFPKVAQIAEMKPADGVGPVAFNGSMLSAFAAIAKRRGDYLRLDISHAEAKPSLIYIGERYRGLLMPLRAEQASKPIASMYVPPREKPKADETKAA